jgi:uncharacterized protein YbbC (DUF1343 family)
MKCEMFTGVLDRWSAAKIGACTAALLLISACGQGQPQLLETATEPIQVGAERTAEYLPLLAGKRVAVASNQTGLIGNVHLVDSLLALKVNVVKVFCPEHGFRGDADAGAHIKDQIDMKTGLPINALYGENFKPTPLQLADVDVIVFDIQDVGVRWYTYISTLHYIMEAAAEQGKQVVILDRPNPNGFFVDGPIMDKSFTSFVGMHPVPIVHGMTVGEYGRMINGEGWLKGGRTCELTVIACASYDHNALYVLPVKPSPNLPNMSSVHLYPSLTLFEGTVVSVGRGTDKPFQCIGYPGCAVGRYTFTPRSVSGAKNPPYLGVECTGLDLQEYGAIQARLDERLSLHWLLEMYNGATDKSGFFNSFFEKLAGGTTLREQIISGADEATIRATWQPGLEAFRTIRAKYLLYPDFTP